MRLLFVASDPMEFRGLSTCTEALQKTRARVDWARTGRLNGQEVMLTANGAGWQRAAAAVDAACETFRPDAVVSIGFCGALDQRLGIADTLVGYWVTVP